MWISNLKIRNFRNYDSLEMVFEKGINYLYGKNGVGKTNLVESIYYMGNLESFRASDDKELIKKEKKEFFIEGIVDGLEYSLLVNKENKLLKIDGILYKKYREYLGKTNVVEFCPEEVYLLKDFPRDRRKFLDKEISKINSGYMHKVLVYNKLLKQRNELLKSEDVYKEQLLSVLDDKMCDLQVDIIETRIVFLKEIEGIVNEFNTSITDKYRLEIKYECCFKSVSKEEMLKQYRECEKRDKERMVTSLGVHKDDFKVYLDECEASGFGSQGEQRFVVLLIKLALVTLIKKRINKWPILVLDDVFSELDDSKKKEIYEIIKEVEQVFITGCDLDEINGINKFSIYEIKGEE